MTFEERKSIISLVNALPRSTHAVLNSIAHWVDHADLEVELCSELDVDDPADEVHGINQSVAESRVLWLVRELISSGALDGLSQLARIARSAE